MLSLREFQKTLQKIRANPKGTLNLGFALLRGFLLKARYRLTNPTIKIGRDFRAYTWIHISGPGKVIVGEKVSVRLSFLRQPSIITHTKDSVVTIGNGCYLGGVRISCVDAVSIGDEALLGSSTVIDSDIIPHANMEIDKKWKEQHVKPIKIGNYFWSGTNSFILGGTIMGDECVLGAGAVIRDKEVADRSLLVGNPARRIGVTREL